MQRYAEAESLLQAVQKQDTSDAEIAYYLGIAEDGLGHEREAQTSFEVAYRQATFRARAAARIGELLARQGDLHQAQKFLKDAVAAAPLDLRTKEQLEAVTRAIGDTAEANRLAHLDEAAAPMSDFLKEETGAPDLPHLAADPYRVLRVATEYMNLGLYFAGPQGVRSNLPAGSRRPQRAWFRAATAASAGPLLRCLLQGEARQGCERGLAGGGEAFDKSGVPLYADGSDRP